MTPQAFITKWGPGGPGFDLNERQGAQPYFMDLCALLGVPTPGSSGDYIFEQDALVLGAAFGPIRRAFAPKRPAATSPRPPRAALPTWPSSCATGVTTLTRWRIS